MTETVGKDPEKKGKVALIVDDDPQILELVDEILKDGGHSTWKVSTISDALSLLQKKEFDVAILDIYLPDGTGLELAGKIKSLKPELPVVIMTGTPRSGNIRESVDAEVDAYLVKPVSAGNLLSLVEELA